MQTVFQENELTFSYLCVEDLPEIVQMLAKESVCKYVFFGPNSELETVSYFRPLADSIRTALEKNALPMEPVFTIRNAKNEFIGQCGLLPVAYSEGNFTIGYTLDEPFWRKGYGDQTCRFLVEYAKKYLKVFRISGDCTQGNVASQKILEKNGFQFEGRQSKYWLKNGEFYDNLLFGLVF